MPKLSGNAVVLTIGICCFAFISGIVLITSVIGCGDPGDPTICQAADQMQGIGVLLMVSAIGTSAATLAVFIKRKLFK